MRTHSRVRCRHAFLSETIVSMRHPLMRVSLCVAAAAVLAGCAPATVKQTNRASDYTAKPQRLYVIAGSGMGWGKEFVDAFQQRFEMLARQCGTAVSFEEVSGLELDDHGIVARTQQFRADTLLFIAHGGGVIMMGGGNRISIRYMATMRDVAQRRNVWRGSFDFGRGGTAIPLAERGAVFAIDLSNSLKEDGLLQGPECKPVELASGHRLMESSGSVSGTAAAAAPAPTPVISPAADNPAATGGQVGLRALDGLLKPADQPADKPAAAQPAGPLSYAERIRRLVLPNVAPKATIPGNPVAVVRLNLAPDGTLLSSALARRSGNADWDTAVMEAVARSAPYPAADNGKVPATFTITFRPR